MNPTKEFRDYLISQGAALVGIGDADRSSIF